MAESEKYINIHAHRVADDPFEQVITNLNCKEYDERVEVPGAIYSIGFHPWEIVGSDMSACIEKIHSAAANSRIVAIGETGIDKAIGTSVEIQTELFERQVEIAVLNRLPVIIHAVKATQELLDFKKSHQPDVPMIIHGFRGNKQTAEGLIAAGYYLSVGHTVVHSAKLAEAVKAVPLERIFIETDESPVPIHKLYLYIAELMDISEQELQQHMSEKLKRLFRRIT